MKIMVFRVGRWDRWTSAFASNRLRNGVARAVAFRSEPPPEHDLILYEFEASPWCRLVREYATILDLTITVRPCPRETLLFGEGSFSKRSNYRKEAMKWHQRKVHNPTKDSEKDNLTFPLLVDRTARTKEKESDGSVILTESYEILEHLWKTYGESVLPTHEHNLRSDQIANASSASFARRFFSLSGPSYIRPWPRCGLMLYPSTTIPNYTSTTAADERTQLILYQSEGCPESRLVREALCCLKIFYLSVPVAEGSSNRLPQPNHEIPVLSVCKHHDRNLKPTVEHILGAEDCLNYLNDAYFSPAATTKLPTWFEPRIPARENLGRIDGANLSIFTSALTAIQKGNKAFVPPQATK